VQKLIQGKDQFSGETDAKYLLSSTVDKMKTTIGIQSVLAGISLFSLAVGFSFIGYLLFINNLCGHVATRRSLDSDACLAGSIASFGIGLAFFIASLIYWPYFAMNRTAQSKKDQQSISTAQKRVFERSSAFVVMY
jgi:hypothetical protein